MKIEEFVRVEAVCESYRINQLGLWTAQTVGSSEKKNKPRAMSMCAIATDLTCHYWVRQMTRGEKKPHTHLKDTFDVMYKINKVQSNMKATLRRNVQWFKTEQKSWSRYSYQVPVHSVVAA